MPGPACYGRGGTAPTVTDANLFLGRLGSKSLLGGDMTLDDAAAQKAINSLAPQAGLQPVEFAEGILAISNAAMADAMRTITVSQGVDPREFTLVAFGGAGPMAAAALAEELDIQEVLIPRFPGTFSAWGMLQTDLRHDFTQSFFRSAEVVSIEDLNSIYDGLESDGQATIAREGIADKNISFLRSADMRYTGQEYTINVTIPAATDIASTISDFHSAHDRRYGHSSPGARVEFVNLRVAAFGALTKYSQANGYQAEESDPAIGERNVVFDGVRHTTPILARDKFSTTFKALGPVIIEEQSATTVVPPDWKVEVDTQGSMLMRRRNA
jgi:N-methylhydantoinase A